MSRFIASLTLLACLCSFAHAKEPKEMDHIHGLDAALQRGGLSELLTIARQHRWQAPRMPSKWSVEHRPGTDEQAKVGLAGREFGRKLAVQLDAVAPMLQDLAPGDQLNRQANLLCDLSDWCASTPGYGNIFLAQRCLDLAAVGLARLAASLDFPLAECEKLAARMSPAWMSVEARARTLNDEAGTNLFTVGGTQAEMEKTWGSGGFLMREKRSGRSRPQGQEPGRGFIETPTLKANLDFFERDEPSAEPFGLGGFAVSFAAIDEPSSEGSVPPRRIDLRQRTLQDAREGDAVSIATYLEAGGDPNLGPLMGDTLLIEAIRSGAPALVELVLSAGADPERPGEFGRTPLKAIDEMSAQCPEKAEAWTRIRQSIADSITKKRTLNDVDIQLHAAIDQGCVENTIKALNKGASPNKADETGQRPLDKATKMGNAKIVALLFETGAEFNPVLYEQVISKPVENTEEEDRQQIRALFRKAWHASQTEFMQRIIFEGVIGVEESGSHPLGYHSIYDPRTGGGCGLFMRAILDGNYELCKVFLEMGADPLYEIPSGMNAFDYLERADASGQERDALKRLLEKHTRMEKPLP